MLAAFPLATARDRQWWSHWHTLVEPLAFPSQIESWINYCTHIHASSHGNWICPKQTRIHGCRLHEIWMEDKRHTHCACGEIIASMQIGWLHFNEAQQVRDFEAQIMRKVYRDTWKLCLFLEHQYQPVSSFLLTAAILVYPYLQLKHCLCTLHQ